MNDESIALRVQQWIDRDRTGDSLARDALLTCTLDRLRRLTRKMLGAYPGVRRWEDTDDVLQNASVRLCRALEDVQPATVQAFFRLAAIQIRRELIDLARRYAGPQGLGANYASRAPGEGAGKPGDERDDTTSWLGNAPADSTHDPSRLAEWTEFHLHVEDLPEEDRAVVDLVFYQGLTAAEAAAILNVSERTVKRRWLSARLELQRALRGRIPGT
jgi:RNA polymerase sigma-70 factor (ECF subfamily)